MQTSVFLQGDHTITVGVPGEGGDRLAPCSRNCARRVMHGRGGICRNHLQLGLRSRTWVQQQGVACSMEDCQRVPALRMAVAVWPHSGASPIVVPSYSVWCN